MPGQDLFIMFTSLVSCNIPALSSLEHGGSGTLIPGTGKPACLSFPISSAFASLPA